MDGPYSPFPSRLFAGVQFCRSFSIRLSFVNASQLPYLSTCGILCSICKELATYGLCERRHICLCLATFSLFPWPVYNFLLYVSCKKKLQNSFLQVSCFKFICSLQKPVKSSINCFFYLLVVRLSHVWTQITLRMFQLRSACFNFGMFVWNVHSLPVFLFCSFFPYKQYTHRRPCRLCNLLLSVRAVFFYVPLWHTILRTRPTFKTHGSVASYICKNLCTCHVPVKNLGKIVNVGKRRRLLTGKLLDGKRG